MIDFLAKVIIVDSGVGKTNVLLNFTQTNFFFNLNTIGVEFKAKVIKIQNKISNSISWILKANTFQSPHLKLLQRICRAVFLNYSSVNQTFSLNDRHSFMNIKHWINNINEHLNRKVAKVLVANKCDLEQQIKISENQIDKLAEEKNVKVFKTSALLNVNIEIYLIIQSYKCKSCSCRVVNEGRSLYEKNNQSSTDSFNQKKGLKLFTTSNESSDVLIKNIDFLLNIKSKKQIKKSLNKTYLHQNEVLKLIINKKCNCKKFNCIKLYCQCFITGLYCLEICNCIRCFNNPNHSQKRIKSIMDILSRDPKAFYSKIIKQNVSGCNCRKSQCLKKYCNCYNNCKQCTSLCQCVDCKNNKVNQVEYQFTN